MLRELLLCWVQDTHLDSPLGPSAHQESGFWEGLGLVECGRTLHSQQVLNECSIMLPGLHRTGQG